MGERDIRMHALRKGGAALFVRVVYGLHATASYARNSFREGKRKRFASFSVWLVARSAVGLHLVVVPSSRIAKYAPHETSKENAKTRPTGHSPEKSTACTRLQCQRERTHTQQVD